MSEVAMQGITREEFERALAVLEAEQTAMRLSSSQKLALRLYTFFIWAFLLLLIAPIIFLLYWSRRGDLPSENVLILGLLVLGAGLCLACTVVLVFLNIPLMVKIARNRIRLRRMGLSDVSEALWKEYQKTRLWPAIVGKIALGVCILFLLISVVLFIESSWLSGAVFLVFGALFLMFYILQNGKARLEMMTLRGTDAAQLKELMVNSRDSMQQADLERIPVPAEAIQQFARIENVQIARSRARAIAESITAPEVGFSILLSQQVLEVKAGLEPGDRLKVEEMLDALMLQPRPASAENDADTGSLRQRVEGTDLELTYDIDEAARQLKLVSLQQQPAVGSTFHA